MCPKRNTQATALLAFLWLAATTAACGDSTVRTNHAMIGFEPLSIDFGKQDSGSSVLKTLKVTNLGTRDLTLEHWEIRDDARHAFSASDVPALIPAGSSATIGITYAAPVAEGPDGARLVIDSNADNAPEAQVSLAGRSEIPCDAGQIFCNGHCFDPAKSNDHCGTCETACANPDVCVDGACACIPTTCSALGLGCGAADDGCGHALDCGGCGTTMECFHSQCVLPTCHDGRRNGSETDVDCGGGACPGCVVTQLCKVSEDCAGGLVCTNGVCSPCVTRAECPHGDICSDGLCGPCATSNDCDADEACVDHKCLSCPSEAAFNECGLCAGPAVPDAGKNCLAPSGCVSTFACTAEKTAAICIPVPVNECGLCGGPAVPGLGAGCTLPNGCPSTVSCNDQKNGALCTPVTRNACDVCGGPALPLLGTPCINANGCSSTYVCDAAGTGVTCQPVTKNECGLCNGPPVSGLGNACTQANGCASTMVCNDQKNGSLCASVTKNECGLCGGQPVTNPVGGSCSSGGCPSTYACNATNTDTECTSVPKNECGKCAGPPVPDLGQPCTSSAGCPSTKICNATATGSVCDVANQNACGLCAGPVINNTPGSSCTQNGCTGTYACTSTKDATVCNATCSTTGHLVISELATATNDDLDEFIELYNPTSAAVNATGYSLWYHSPSTGSTSLLITLSGAKATIGSHKFLLVAFQSSSNKIHEYATTPPDFTYNAASMATWDGTVILTRGSTKPTLSNLSNAEDAVGYGSPDSGWYEKHPAASPPPPVYSSIERKAQGSSTTATMIGTGSDATLGNGWDTDDNAADFVTRDTRQPQNSSSPTEP